MARHSVAREMEIVRVSVGPFSWQEVGVEGSDDRLSPLGSWSKIGCGPNVAFRFNTLV